jgi:hypothetical protein
MNALVAFYMPITSKNKILGDIVLSHRKDGTKIELTTSIS